MQTEPKTLMRTCIKSAKPVEIEFDSNELVAAVQDAAKLSRKVAPVSFAHACYTVSLEILPRPPFDFQDLDSSPGVNVLSTSHETPFPPRTPLYIS